MTIAEYEALKALLEPVLGQDRPIEPGTSFGPMVDGEVRGELSDFAWSADFRPFVRETVFADMQAAGFPVAGVKVQLKSKRNLGEPLVQLEVRPTAKIAGSVETKLCDVCGLTEVGRKRIVDLASFDNSIPIQSVYEIPTFLVVSETFAKFIRGRKLTGVKLTPAKVE